MAQYRICTVCGKEEKQTIYSNGGRAWDNIKKGKFEKFKNHTPITFKDAVSIIREQRKSLH